MSTPASVHSPSRRSIPTDEELMDLPKDGYKRELLHGEIVMSPGGWVMDPKGKVIQVHREVERCTVLPEVQTLTGESVVPGFQIAVSAVFAGML